MLSFFYKKIHSGYSKNKSTFFIPKTNDIKMTTSLISKLGKRPCFIVLFGIVGKIIFGRPSDRFCSSERFSILGLSIF